MKVFEFLRSRIQGTTIKSILFESPVREELFSSSLANVTLTRVRYLLQYEFLLMNC